MIWLYNLDLRVIFFLLKSTPSVCVAMMNSYRDGECIAPCVCFHEMTDKVYKRKWIKDKPNVTFHYF